MVKKGQAGFYLTEVVIALFLFLFLSSALLSGWQLLAQLKVEKKLDSLALDLIQNEAELFYAYLGEDHDGQEVRIDDYLFYVKRTVEDGGKWQRGKVEIRWRLPSGKEKQLQLVMYRDKPELPPWN